MSSQKEVHAAQGSGAIRQGWAYARILLAYALPYMLPGILLFVILCLFQAIVTAPLTNSQCGTGSAPNRFLLSISRQIAGSLSVPEGSTTALRVPVEWVARKGAVALCVYAFSLKHREGYISAQCRLRLKRPAAEIISSNMTIFLQVFGLSALGITIACLSAVIPPMRTMDLSIEPTCPNEVMCSSHVMTSYAMSTLCEASVSVAQFNSSLCIGPMASLLGTLSYNVASCFVFSPLLIGSFGMMMRYSEQAAEYPQAALCAIAIILASLALGLGRLLLSPNDIHQN